MLNSANSVTRTSAFLTGHDSPDAAHIFPFSLLKGKTQRLHSQKIDFWALLGMFWDKERVRQWRETVFRDANKPETPTDGCDNLICLSPTMHRWWNDGRFALKPISVFPDEKEVTMQFYWQPIFQCRRSKGEVPSIDEEKS